MNFLKVMKIFILPPNKWMSPITTASSVRYCHKQTSKETTKRKSIYKSEEAKKIRFYFVRRYVEYLKSYVSVLEKRFPTAVQTYRLFMDGVRSFLKDTKEYIRILMLLNKPGNKLSSLLRRELELYLQLPGDMRRVAPVLIISSLPAGPYIIIPLAYMFPRHLLCSHFWTPQQRKEYPMLMLRDRLCHNRPILRHLQGQLEFVQPQVHRHWNKLLGQLGSGTHPTIREILQCKELFGSEPYHLYYLSSNHVRHLLGMHEMHRGWLRRTRLAERALLLKEMDKAIMREGGVHNLSEEVLRNSCIIRGLNPTNLTTENMVTWLTKWICLSGHVDHSCYSASVTRPNFISIQCAHELVLGLPQRK